jgi:hypothetical protein
MKKTILFVLALSALLSCKKESLSELQPTPTVLNKTSSEWEIFYDFIFYDINSNPIRITDCDYSGGTCLPEVTVTPTIAGTINAHNQNGTLKDFFTSGDYLEVWPDLDTDIYEAIVDSSNKIVLLHDSEDEDILILVVVPSSVDAEEPVEEYALYALQVVNE